MKLSWLLLLQALVLSISMLLAAPRASSLPMASEIGISDDEKSSNLNDPPTKTTIKTQPKPTITNKEKPTPTSSEKGSPNNVDDIKTKTKSGALPLPTIEEEESVTINFGSGFVMPTLSTDKAIEVVKEWTKDVVKPKDSDDGNDDKKSKDPKNTTKTQNESISLAYYQRLTTLTVVMSILLYYNFI